LQGLLLSANYKGSGHLHVAQSAVQPLVCVCVCVLQSLHAAEPRDDLLRRVREVVEKYPSIMKYETRHAKDGDYKADVMVGTAAGAARATAQCEQLGGQKAQNQGPCIPLGQSLRQSNQQLSRQQAHHLVNAPAAGQGLFGALSPLCSCHRDCVTLQAQTH
jgi:hypothetical protein